MASTFAHYKCMHIWVGVLSERGKRRRRKRWKERKDNSRQDSVEGNGERCQP